MRETIGEWRNEWIATNGETDELEVIIEDSNQLNYSPCMYEGSFVSIPEPFHERKVIGWGKIIDSTVRDRIGAYRLTI